LTSVKKDEKILRIRDATNRNLRNNHVYKKRVYITCTGRICNLEM